jgi:integrase
MTRRSGQNGSVVSKGLMWHGRYYADVPGQEQRRRMSVPLGLVAEMTKPEARRRLREVLDSLGINTAEYLDRALNGVKTFGGEAEWWKENRLPLMKESTQHVMGGHLNRYLLPHFGHLPVTAVEERRVQEFITTLTRIPLSVHTIQNVIGTLRLILGKKVWRDWDLAMPRQERKEQRYFTPEEMGQIIDASSGQWRVIFALLAGTGMRGGEAFGLRIEDVELVRNTIAIRRGTYRGRETTPKTESAYRTVNIDDGLAEMLRQHIAGRQSGHLFVTQVGTLFTVDYARKKLQAILKKLGLPDGGPHAFRHGRVSILQSRGVPSDLVKEWIGHSSLKTTSRYTHFQADYKEEIANSLGFGRPMDPIPYVPTISKYGVN